MKVNYMPNYEYHCSCGKVEIRTFNIGKKPDYIMCTCGKRANRKIIIPPVHFVGEGFTTGKTKVSAHIKESYET